MSTARWVGMNIDEVLFDIQDKCPEWASLIDVIDFHETADVALTANDGRNISFNGRRLRHYTPQGKAFIIAQQLLHIQFDHERRGEGKDPVVWGKACDAVANAMLMADGFEAPADMLFMERAQEMSADELYDVLIDELDEEDKKVDDADKEEDEVILVPDDEGKNKQAGTDKGAEKREIDDPGLAKAVSDLAELLEPSMQIDYDWFPGDTIRDGMLRERFLPYQVPHAEILLDTSASIDAQLLRTFVSGVKGLMREDAVVKVGCFDTEFYGWQEIATEQDIQNIELRGSGGTNFEVAVKSFSGDAETRIIFTDGYAEMPDQRCDVIWLVYSDIPIEPKGGRVIYVKEAEELEEYEIDFLIT